MNKLSKTISTLGPPLAGAMLIAALVAVSAQAQVVINPDNTNITGIANDPSLDYEGTTVVCDSGTAIGTTGNNSDFVDVTLDFLEPCTVGAAVDMNVTRTGSSWCGPASGVLGFDGVYDLNPDVSFD
jgi:hypothetical protein